MVGRHRPLTTGAGSSDPHAFTGFAAQITDGPRPQWPGRLSCPPIDAVLPDYRVGLLASPAIIFQPQAFSWGSIAARSLRAGTPLLYEAHRRDIASI